MPTPLSSWIAVGSSSTRRPLSRNDSVAERTAAVVVTAVSQALAMLVAIGIAWVDGGIFAYELSRDGFDGTDCRIPSVSHNRPWLPFKLSTDEHRAISAFMEATGYSFGRLDFLRDNRGLLFLELNPNGQFAWLDPHGDNGLLDAVAEAVRKVHISNRPGIPAGAGGA